MHLIGTDIETTGLDKKRCSVTEIAFVHYNGEERVSDFVVKIKPADGSDISLGALKVTKQTIDTLYNTDCVDRTQAVMKIVEYFVTKVFPVTGNKEVKILGHNVAFDVVRIRQLLDEFNITGWDEVFSYRLMDTAGQAELLREAGVLELDKMSLGNLAKALGIEVEDGKLHGALYDIDTTFKCYFKMLKLLRGLNGKAK